MLRLTYVSKTCTSCHSICKLDEFSKHPQKCDGLQSCCKKCTQERTAVRVDCMYQEQDFTTYISSHVYGQLKHRAMKANLLVSPRDEFMVDFEGQFKATRGCCPFLKIPYKLDRDRKNNYAHPSPDQLIPKGGYVVGNIQWVSWMFNRMKGDTNHETVVAILNNLSI